MKRRLAPLVVLLTSVPAALGADARATFSRDVAPILYAQCAACHMPAKTYMGVDLQRDHSFRVPRPDLTEKIGVPNTCNACHTDRSSAWAASTVADWYPHGRQTTPHYGTALHAGRVGASDAETRLDALILDRDASAMARASALPLLARHARQPARRCGGTTALNNVALASSWPASSRLPRARR